MDKQFWKSIQDNDFAFPAGQSLPALTEELFSLLASTDPELRDTLGLEIFYHWLKQGLYTPADVRSFIPRLTANLETGIGETDSDSVFLRSFSALWLALIIDNDTEKPALKQEEVAPILEAALAHLAAERDLRGNVPIKGWAHAIAHNADLMAALALSPHTAVDDHLRILTCIASKLKDATHWIYLYGEDGRLARAVIRVFRRDTLSIDQVKDWLAFLSSEWNGAWGNEESTLAFHSCRNFVRALHWQLLSEDELPKKETLQKLLREALDQVQLV